MLYEKPLSALFILAFITFFVIGIFYPAIGILALACMLGPVLFSAYKG